MTIDREKQLLVALLAALTLLVLYRVLTAPKPRTAPLTYRRGAVATSPVRQNMHAAGRVDPLETFLLRREEKYPGVRRDLFRMENPAPRPKPKPKPKPVPVSVTTPTVPPPPVKTPEELAAEAAKTDLAKFRFLGYLTDQDSSLFLSKDGELFIVKNGDPVLGTYRVKEAGKDYVVLRDSATGVERRIMLSGGDEQRPGPTAPSPYRPFRPR